MGHHDTITLSTEIAVPPSELYRALTYSQALTEWLCDEARSDPRVGGRLWLWRRDDEFMAGEYTEVEPDRRVRLLLFSRGLERPGTLEFEIEATDRGSRLTLSRDLGVELPAETREHVEAEWRRALDNLRAVLEEGDDLRQSQRPLMGIYFGNQITADNRSQYNVPVDYGMQISGTVDGSAAETAGIQAGDVLVAIGEHETRDWAGIGAAIRHFTVDETTEVTLYRDGEQMAVPLTFGRPPAQPVPADPTDFAAQLRGIYDDLLGEIDALVEGVDTEVANRRPAEGEWSANHVIAHIIGSEWGNQALIANLLEGYDASGFPSNNDLFVESFLESIGDQDRLMHLLRITFDTTVRMVEKLPAEFVAHRGSYEQLGRTLIHNFPIHTRFHIGQLQAALETEPAPA